jgi:hypothetical protein
MRRGFLIALLSIGTIAGFASGFSRMHHYREHGGWYGCGHHAPCGCPEAEKKPEGSPAPTAP